MGYGKMLDKHMEFVMDREEYYHSCTVIVVVIAIVLVIVDVDDEEGGREDECFFGIHIGVRKMFCADALQRRLSPQLMLRVDDMCRFYA